MSKFTASSEFSTIITPAARIRFSSRSQLSGEIPRVAERPTIVT